MKKILPLFLLFLIILSLSSQTVFAISEEAANAREAVDMAKTQMEDIAGHGLPTTRYGDILALAEQLYDGQLAIETGGGKSDYSLVHQKLSELEEIRKNAYNAFDELVALESALNRTTIDAEPALKLYNQAKAEFADERYEESLKMIDLAYKKISELEALQTKVKAFYDAASRTAVNFLKENWKEIAAIMAAIAVALLLGYNRLAILLTERKIRNLELRKKSVRGLIAEAQREFFEKGQISEVSYKIKTQTYGEILRDINRQIPLLKEELQMRLPKNRGGQKK